MGFDLAVWLRSVGLEQYEAVFRENPISEKVLPRLTAEDLKDLDVSIVGHRRVLLDAITDLRSGTKAEQARGLGLRFDPLQSKAASRPCTQVG